MQTKLLMLPIMVCAAFAGCRGKTAAQQDARDRENPLVRRAMEREQAGDLEGAVRSYEEALLEAPRLASAHLQLALLLQDYRRDYMGAIYHYRQYDVLRPASEKHDTGMIKDRIHMSEQLLAAQLLSRGDVAISREQQKLVAEIERLNQRLSVAEGEKASLQEQKNTLERLLAEQKTETERLRRLVDRLQLPGSEASGRERSILPRLGSPSPAGTPARPPPAAAHAELSVPPVETSSRAPAPPAPGEIVPVPRAAESAAADEPASALRTPPGTAVTSATRTYVVQPGDSLFRIAERVYGDPMQWKRVRDANKERIDPEGHLRAGQVLIIP